MGTYLNKTKISKHMVKKIIKHELPGLTAEFDHKL